MNTRSDNRAVTRPSRIPELTERGFVQIRQLVERHFGIHLTEEKRMLVLNRLHLHVTSSGFPSFEAYAAHVEGDASGKALDVLANLISTGHTSFFREKDQFTFLSDQVLPDLAGKLRQVHQNDLRIWSAGVATGEEAYSIVMTLREHFGPSYGQFDGGVLATDISTRALAVGSAGLYSRQQLERVPPPLRLRYFRPCGEDQYRVAPELRGEVLFRKFNLMSKQYPFKKPFDVIFCRNVMIYFQPATRRALAEKLYEMTMPGGYLFLGQAERLGDDAGLFEQVRPAVYWKPADGRARKARRP